jgi:hypothetical protein
MCWNIQTPEELKEVWADPEDAYFNCIGRFTKAKWCDWSLWWLFQIHKVCVEKDGEYHAVFEFAD